MKENPTPSGGQQWIPFKRVQQHLGNDPVLRNAIQQSQDLIDEFLSALKLKQPRQSDFVVTVMLLSGSDLQPVGIAVDSVDGECVTGRKLRNSLIPSQPGVKVMCQLTDVVDWRYTDTFEAIGARLYRELYFRQPRRIRFDIRDYQSFLIERDSPVPSYFRGVMRDIAHLQYEKVREKIEQDPSLLGRSGAMPVLNQGSGRRITLLSLTPAEYCAMYGDDKMVNLLHEYNAFREWQGDQSPLTESAWAGNLSTVACFIELGFDVNCRDDGGTTPLLQAVQWNHLSVVKLLLEKGAECDLRGIDGSTPLFRAETVDIARELIAAGADVNAINDAGYSCFRAHLEEGHSAIAQLLMERGAEVNADPTVALEERLSLEESRKLLAEYAKIQHPNEPEYWTDFDYGFVLPVRSIRIN